MSDTQGPADRPEWLTKATTPTYCYRHPDRQTGLRCSRCDRPICGECANPAPVGQLCPDDARATVRTRGLPGSEAPPGTQLVSERPGRRILMDDTPEQLNKTEARV